MSKLFNKVKEKCYKNEKKLTILFFAVLFIFGLFFIGDIGFYNDEGSEQTILKNNIYEYARQFGNNDLTLYFQEKNFTPISMSVERDHGVAPYYFFAPFLTLDKVSTNLLSNAWHLYTFVLFFLGVICFYLLSKTLFKKKSIALLATLIFFFTPKILIDGMYNNKDSILMSFTIMSLYFGVKFIKNKDYKSALLFGLISAFTCNLKISGFFVFGMVGLFYLMNLTFYKKWSKKAFLSGILAIVSCFGLYLLITPAIWGNGFNLIDFINWCLSNSTKFSRWSGTVLFEGVLYDNRINPLPWYYLPKMIIITIPVYIVVLAILSFVLFVFKSIKDRKIDEKGMIYLMLALIIIVPSFVAMVSSPNIYNGWRHFYFLYGPIALLAGFCLYYSLDFKWTKVLQIISCIFVLINVVIICIYGVFCTCYFNVLATGNITKKFELNYYSVPSKVILEDIVDNNRGCDKDGKCYIAAKNFASIELDMNYKALPHRYQDKIILVKKENLKQIQKDKKKIIYYVNPTYDFNSYKGYKKIYEKKMFNYTVYYLYTK